MTRGDGLPLCGIGRDIDETAEVGKEIPTGFCAHCTEEDLDLVQVDYDGRTVWMCWDCREGPVDGYTFNEGTCSVRCGRHRKPGRHGRSDG